MGDKTGISWTGSTWNVLRGCSREMAEGAKTSGCGDPTGGGCYAERDGYRFAGPGLPYEGLVRMTPNGPRWTGQVILVDKKLLDPVRWDEPRMIFTTSVSDPFHPKLSNQTIALLYGVMAITPRHTHQVLTKRARRRREWHAWVAAEAAAANDGNGMTPAAYCFTLLQAYVNGDPRGAFSDHDRRRLANGDIVNTALSAAWPLANVWEGASVEHQLAANDRIPDLLMTPAAVRFLSCEPMIGAIDLLPWFDPTGACDCAPGSSYCVGGCPKDAEWRGTATMPGDEVASDPEIHWVIAGCESGPGAREADVEWYRLLRDRCADAGVSFFLKQAEESADCGEDGILQPGDDDSIAFGDGSKMKRRRPGGNHIIELPHLDDVQHAEFPEVHRG